MLGKLTTIDSVERWVRAQSPAHPYYTIYNGFQVTAKKPSDIAFNNHSDSNLEESIRQIKQFLVDRSTNGGQWTIFLKSSPDKQDTTGKTDYVELLPYGAQPQGHYAIAGLQNSTVSQGDIDAKISGAVNAAYRDWEKDMTIKGLISRIEELENEEPEGVDFAGVAIGLAETLINKIPNDTIGRIFENLFAKAEGETVDKLANIGNVYMNMKMQEAAAKQAAQQQKKTHPPKDDQDEDEEYV